MVNQFQFFGTSPQLMAKNTLMAGQTLTGHKFTVTELLYNAPVFPGAQTNKSYAVDVFGTTDTPQCYGFESREEAERFIHSNAAEEYVARDIHGNEGKQTRVGLGVPEGMVSRLDGSAAPSMAKLLQAQAVAERANMERGPNPRAGQAPDNPDTKPSSNPAPAAWPVVSVPDFPGRDTGPQATGPGIQETDTEPGPTPLGKPGDAVPFMPDNPPGTDESVSDGSDVTNPDLDNTGFDTDPEN